MATKKTWVVPGAPLENGRGWRIWYSRPGLEDFEPDRVRVLRGAEEEQIDRAWRLLDPVAGFGRRMGILTVEVTTPSPEAEYSLLIPEAPVKIPLRWKLFPQELGSGVTFLLASCFWEKNDKEGAYSKAIRDLHKLWSPAFKLLAGDQVYQDWPPALGPETSLELYGDRYEEYWGQPAYQEVLLSTPNYFLCDDHEFWNNYPEKQIHLARTFGPRRDEHARAAGQLYELFQRAANPGTDPWYTFRVGPVSFFVTDTRSQRDFWDASPHHFFQAPQWEDLERWVDGLNGPGVLILGQPLFQRDGDWKDYSLSNFEDDYGRLCNLIEASLRGENRDRTRHDILMLSGDIHSGRFCLGRIAGLDGIEVPEFISSPVSRVGPYISEPTPDGPPTRFRANHGGRTTVWQIRQAETPTIHNNVGMVRMTPGTSGRVRFELTVWRVRPYDDRPFWERALNRPQPQGPVIPLLHREIQLG